MIKPVPKATSETEAFWQASRERRLIYQFCEDCGHVQFPPSPICKTCASSVISWRESSGRGVVHSFTYVHRAPTAAFRSDCPYVVALVDFDEGFRMMMNLRRLPGHTVAIGSKVSVWFEEREDTILPQGELVSE